MADVIRTSLPPTAGLAIGPKCYVQFLYLIILDDDGEAADVAGLDEGALGPATAVALHFPRGAHAFPCDAMASHAGTASRRKRLKLRRSKTYSTGGLKGGQCRRRKRRQSLTARPLELLNTSILIRSREVGELNSSTSGTARSFSFRG